MEEHPQGGAHHSSPEQREHLQINGIVIPTGDKQPLYQAELDPTSANQFRQLIGGDLEVATLRYPPSSLYFNIEGKLEELRVNRRATALLWMHSPAMRYEDVIVGDAMLVGPVDSAGIDTDVPDHFVSTLFEVQRFRIQVQSHDDPRWFDHGFKFDNWIDAYAFALKLGLSRSIFDDVRVVPDEPVQRPKRKRSHGQQT